MPGVVRTRVGYTGGTSENPTYTHLGDHSETVQIDFDPNQISYEELLDVFWDSHNPRAPAFTPQYASIIFYHNDDQKRAALETKTHLAAQGEGRVWTEIVPVSQFYRAEDYHQKYQLRRVKELEQWYTTIYPDDQDWSDSTATARINGYLGGHGTLEQLQAEIEGYGLSPESKERLLDILSARWGESVRQACPL